MRTLIVLVAAFLVTLPSARADEGTPYTQAELDQMLAPIALYPDPLLSQVLMAATYPLEVVEAARWSRAHAGLKGDEAVRSAADQDWDPSVKSLLAFPQLLQRMDENLDWTKQLGDAFLSQEPHVMETIQQLRRKAQAAGQLESNERVHVTDEGGYVAIAPADPLVVYVPYYDPLIVYGTWWWPAYPPVAWAPWAGYVVHRPGLWWGFGVRLSTGFFFGGVTWPQRHVTVVRTNVYYVRPPAVRRRVVAQRPLAVGAWRHDPAHRRGVVYRSPEVRHRYAPAAPGVVAPSRRAEPPAQRRIERQDHRRDERRPDRRDDRRGHAMPPAFRASAPAAPRADLPRAAAPRAAPPRAAPPRAAAPPAAAPRAASPRGAYAPPRAAEARMPDKPILGAEPEPRRHGHGGRLGAQRNGRGG